MVCRLVVKPVESKKFTGKVISSIKDLIGCGAYNEDWHYNYDAEVLDEIMDQFIEWDKRPMACSIDIGVTKDGRTLLIECNDAYSLGAYGLVDYKYTKLLSARWSQLLEREDVFDYRKYQ